MPTPAEIILGAAESALGVMYQWGGNSLASGVDCSGLVQQAFRAAGYQLPRVSRDQARVGAQVSLDQLQPGDLVYWDNSDRNNGADHISIYIGNGMIIEAYGSGKPVRVTALAGRNPTGARRIVGAVEAHPGVTAPVKLGPNEDRRYTTAALNPGAQAPAPTVSAAAAGDAAPGGGIGDDLPPDATPEQIEAYIRKHYSDVAPFLANPEIKQLAYTAAMDDLSPEELNNRFRQTEYYKTHGPSSMAFDELISRGGPAAGQLVDTAKNTLGDFLSRSGVSFTDEQLGVAAKQAIRHGWINLGGQVADPNALNDFAVFALGAQRKPDGTLPSGTAAVTADALGAIASQYFVPMTRQDLERWALDIQAGKATEEQFQHEMALHSKDLFQNAPDLQRAIDSGRTPDQYFAPIRNVIAQTLELAPDQVDLMSPRYREVLQMHDAKAGISRPMTIGEVTKWARGLEDFKRTREYQSTESEIGMQMMRSMGVLA